MITLLLFACADSPDSTLDDDNWLKGPLVDEYHPKIADVEIHAGTIGDSPNSFSLYYLDEDDVELVIVLARWTDGEDGTVVFDESNRPMISASFHHWPNAAVGFVDLRLEPDSEWANVSGTFDVEQGGDLHGAFSGPVIWD